MGLSKQQRAEIRSKLEGLSHRNKAREWSRAELREKKRVWTAKRKGLLDGIDACLNWLEENGFEYKETILLGARRLDLDCGLILYYCLGRMASKHGIIVRPKPEVSGDLF